MSWHVLYTKSRCEKAVSSKLTQMGFDVFCPLIKRTKMWSDRKKTVEEPLFRSYCFVDVNEATREKALHAPGAVRYVFHCGKPAIIRDREMEQLKQWLQIYDHESIQALEINPRDIVRIQTGALKEQSAMVVEASRHYAVLLLENIGLQVKVDLRKNILEKVG